MHERAWLDGEVVRADEARVGATAAGVLCGAGVFTTLRLHAGRPFLWEAHEARLRRGAEALGLGPGAVPEGGELRAALEELAMQNGADRALARITVLEGEGELWRAGDGGAGPAGRPAHVVIFTRPLGEPRAIRRVGLSGWPVFSGSRLSGHKLVSYVEPWLALREARAQGFDEAVRLNEQGGVAGGCRCTFLCVKAGRVRAPGPNEGGVRSTTLDWALGWLEARGQAVSLGFSGWGDLLGAQELLALSSGIGVQGVERFQDHSLPGGSGELARELGEAYEAACSNTV